MVASTYKLIELGSKLPGFAGGAWGGCGTGAGTAPGPPTTGPAGGIGGAGILGLNDVVGAVIPGAGVLPASSRAASSWILGFDSALLSGWIIFLLAMITLLLLG